MDNALGWQSLYLWPALAAIGLWGLTTFGLILINLRPLWQVRMLVWPAAALLVAVLGWVRGWGLEAGGLGAQYAAFAAGMLAYTWQEQLFYAGLVTGPNRRACPPDCRGWPHFNHALATHRHHELAMLAGALALWALFAGTAGLLALWTYVLLWFMMHLAKLNVFLGVRSLPANLFPPHLAYLRSFWRHSALNPLFVPSLATAALLALGLWNAAVAVAPAPGAAGLAMLACLTTLGVIELAMLMVPFTRAAAAVPEIVPAPGAAD